ESGLEPLGNGWTITLVRRTPLTQEIDLARQGELDAEVLEKGYDKLTMVAQELSEKMERCVKYPVSTQVPQEDTDSFLDAISAAKQAAAQSSAQAATSATQAATSATQAATSATQAGTSATQAGTSATQAASSATAAENSATSASQSVSQIQTVVASKADVGLGNLTDAGKIQVTHLAMPSNVYDNLTIGATGDQYTAPADGYFQLNAKLSNAGNASVDSTSAAYMSQVCYISSSSNWIRLFLPVQKGTAVKLYYYPGLSSSVTNTFQFIYAIGSESEKQS
ncbi:MAG: hypothetical protein IKO35_02850, partial [Elusimicrobiaceae bacterium]|nr:hypothetical protein [Elusimicrobiaceae bacterium]